MIRSSETVGELAAALAKAQSEFPVVPKLHRAKIPTKSGGEYSYNYADLADTVAAASPVLTANGLSVSHHPDFDGYDLLTTRLMHVSGEWLEASMRLFLSAESPQAHGSAITYAKRYAYSSIIGLVADEDDDGASATHPQTYSKPKPKQYEVSNGERIPAEPPMESTRSYPAPSESDVCSSKQANFAKALLMGAGLTEDDKLATWFKTNECGAWPGSVRNLSKFQANKVIELLRP